MIKILFPAFMVVIVLSLLKSGRLSLDLSGILIASLSVLLLAAANEEVLILMSKVTSIVNPPLAIIGIAIGLLLGIVVVLAIMVNDARNRQKELLLRIAAIELYIKKID